METKDIVKKHVFCYVARKKTADDQHMLNRRIGNTDLCFAYGMYGDSADMSEFASQMGHADFESLPELHGDAIANTLKLFKELDIKILNRDANNRPTQISLGFKDKNDFGFTCIFFKPVRLMLQKMLGISEVYVMPISKEQALVTDFTVDTKQLLKSLINTYDDMQNKGYGAAARQAMLTETVYSYNLITADIKINTAMFRP